MQTPKIDWCQLMIESIQNVLIEQLMPFLRENVPEAIQQCPYNVIMTVKCRVVSYSEQLSCRA